MEDRPPSSSVTLLFDDDDGALDEDGAHHEDLPAATGIGGTLIVGRPPFPPHICRCFLFVDIVESFQIFEESIGTHCYQCFAPS